MTEPTIEYRVVQRNGVEWAGFYSEERCRQEVAWLDEHVTLSGLGPFSIQSRVISEWEPVP
jgi:hypothetical protein